MRELILKLLGGLKSGAAPPAFAGDAPDAGLLLRERDGYKAAYEATATALGTLRIVAAPVIRESGQPIPPGPGIFVVTLPKSGTVFIGHSLRLTLGYDYTNTLVTPTFPKNVVWETMAGDFMRGGMVSVSHMEPDAANLAILKQAGITRGVLHVRDPRAALHSWLHFQHSLAARQKGAARTGDFMAPISSGFLDMSPEAQVDSLVPSFYEPAVAWLCDWMRAIDNDPCLNFLVMTHEQLAADAEGYLRQVLAHHGLDVPVSMAELNAETHFRNGNNTDWRVTFTPAQIERLNAMLPASLRARFGWAD